MKSKEYVMLEEEIKEDIENKLRKLPSILKSLTPEKIEEVSRFINDELYGVCVVDRETYKEIYNSPVGTLTPEIRDGELVFIADFGPGVEEYTPEELADGLDEMIVNLLDLGVLVSSLYEGIN